MFGTLSFLIFEINFFPKAGISYSAFKSSLIYPGSDTPILIPLGPSLKMYHLVKFLQVWPHFYSIIGHFFYKCYINNGAFESILAMDIL